MTSDQAPDPVAESDDSPIIEDCPCANCGQNLKGLKPSDKCPVCKEPVGTTLDLVVDEVLCMNCMKPNPTVAVRCVHCGGPMNTFSSIADLEAGRPPMPSVLLKSDNTLEERLAHARSRMWIALIFLGPGAITMLPLIRHTLHSLFFETREVLQQPVILTFSLLFLAIFGGLVWLLYFVINRYMTLRVQLAESKMEPSQSTDKNP